MGRRSLGRGRMAALRPKHGSRVPAFSPCPPLEAAAASRAAVARVRFIGPLRGLAPFCPCTGTMVTREANDRLGFFEQFLGGAQMRPIPFHFLENLLLFCVRNHLL